MGVNRPSNYFAVVEQDRGLELQYQLTEAEKTRANGANNNGGAIRGTTRMGVRLLSDPTSRSSSQSNGITVIQAQAVRGSVLFRVTLYITYIPTTYSRTGHALFQVRGWSPCR